MVRHNRPFANPRRVLAVCLLVAIPAMVGAAWALGQGQDSTTQAQPGCPVGWFDAGTTQILCASGFQLETRSFGGAECIRCVPGEPTSARQCSGSWRRAELEFGCGPGYEMVYSPDGACKRCEPVRATSCRSDADCVVSGCSGQVCASESVVTTCEWLPEYACYQQDFARCACTEGQCGWAANAELAQCLQSASAQSPEQAPQ